MRLMMQTVTFCTVQVGCLRNKEDKCITPQNLITKVQLEDNKGVCSILKRLVRFITAILKIC